MACLSCEVSAMDDRELMERVIVAMIYAAPILADLAKEAEQTAETPRE